MIALRIILDPSATLYYCGGCRFNKDKSQAQKFATREEAIAKQNEFGDLELQMVEV